MVKDLPPETERIIFITLPLKDLIPSQFYLAFWSFKMYWYYYYSLLRSNFRTMRVGNIFETLMMIPKSFVYAQYIVKENLDQHRITAYRAYMMLVGKPVSFDSI